MLTDEEKRIIANKFFDDYSDEEVFGFAEAIERAVLAKAMPIPKQEPVGYVVIGQGISFYRTTKEEAEYQANALEWRDDKEPVIHPVYIEPYKAQAAAIPDGYCLAPKEPTASMLDAGVAMALQVSVHGEGGWSKYLRGLYKQMLSASQKPE